MDLARFVRAGVGSCALAAPAALIAAPAEAGMMMLSFDLNSVVIEAEDDFDGVTDTGTLSLSRDTNAEIVDLRVGGAPRQLFSDLAELDGEIRLENGVVTGGSLMVRLADGSIYNAAISGDEGAVRFTVAEGFTVDGSTRSGSFLDLGSESLFGGVDVSPLAGQTGLTGSFFLFGYDPDEDGFDADANLEIYIVPPPGSGALGLAALALAGLRRRR
jgi:hypothetical protein